MGVKVTGMEDVLRKADPKRIMPKITEAVQEGLKEGAAEGKEMIEARGTNRQWSRPWRSERSGRVRDHSGVGRVDSGNMRDQFDSFGIESSGSTVRGSLGWRPGSEEYFREQEYGFYHELAQRDVPGMMVLRDVGEITEDKIVQKLNEATSELFD